MLSLCSRRSSQVSTVIVTEKEIRALYAMVCQSKPLTDDVLNAFISHVTRVFRPIVSDRRRPTKSLVPDQDKLISAYDKGQVELKVLSHQSQWHPIIPYILEEYIQNALEKIAETAIDEDRSITVDDVEGL